MQINLLKKVVEETVGSPAVKIIDLLYKKKDVNEFLIAKKLGLTINQTRNLLYKLSYLGILTSIRRKDKRKGWYIYFWTINALKSLEVLADSILKEINNLKSQLQSKKSKRFYKCKICGKEVNEETALLSDFTCTDCGEVYDLADNSEVISELFKKIEKLQKELDALNLELHAEKQDKDKKLSRFSKREEAKRKKERKAKFLANKKLKLKEAKIQKKGQKKPKKVKPSKKKR